MSTFEVLNKINVNNHTEQKNGLTYLSWAWAWAEVKKQFPDATYEILMFNGLPYVYDEKTGYMVYTTVTIEGITHMMWLPVMDGANKAMKSEPYTYTVKNQYFKYAKYDEEKGSYFDKYGNEQTEYITKPVEAATMFDVNKTVMRCLVKNLAMFGLGLYIYAGEDLPETEQPQFDPEKVGEQTIDQIKVNAIINEAGDAGVPVDKILERYHLGSIYDMTEKQFSNCHNILQKTIKSMKKGA